METFSEQFKNITKYWWLMLILGILLMITGIIIFIWPTQSYISMAIILPVAMILLGIVNVIMAFKEKYIRGRGWLAVSGIIEVILGVLLLIYTDFSATLLPYFFGFWLLLRGINQIGLARELSSIRVSEMGWSIVSAILLLICALIVLFNPMFGITTIVLWVGVSFLMIGISLFAYSFDLYSIKKKYKKDNEQ